jgi:multiple sugar transport system ATP-binding protein
MAEVALKNIRKEFGDIVAVSDVPVRVEDGELLVLLGPSGCGKSTTLRLVGGLEHPTEGQIEVGERDVTNIPPDKRDIAMVFQDLALYPHKSVRENMAFGLKMRGVSEEEANKQVENVAEMLQIVDLLDRSPAQLSGGQQQRVAIGRAIVRDPQVFLLDEPLSDLDAKLRADLRTEILELHQELGSTMIHVTHDQQEAMTLGDRIAVMNDGKIHQLADPDTIYNKPADLFVARFIGNPDMNFFDGTAYPSGEQMLIKSNILNISLDFTQWQYQDDIPVRIGIRPEAFHISGTESRQIDQPVTISAEIQLVENLGDQFHIHLEAGGKEFVANVNHTNANVGETIEFVLDTNQFHYFDIESEDRITELDEADEHVKLVE